MILLQLEEIFSSSAFQVIMIFFALILGVIIGAWAINNYLLKPKKERTSLLAPVKKQSKEWGQAAKQVGGTVSKAPKNWFSEWGEAFQELGKNMKKLFGVD